MKFAVRDPYGNKEVWEADTNNQFDAYMMVSREYAKDSDRIVSTMLVLVEEGFQE
jgi:hypothetical protein